MKIYVSHSSKYDYFNNIYNPIKNSDLISDNTFFFPHETENVVVNTKEIISNYDLVMAETSLATTGQGIELGWADYAGTPIICVYKKGSTLSSALQFIAHSFIEYENEQDMISKLKNYLDAIKQDIVQNKKN
jgi:hypothetical protein